MARPSCFRLLTHWVRRAASRAAWTAGRSRAIRTAMMAITTRSSISVKPRAARVRKLMDAPLKDEKCFKHDADCATAPESWSFRGGCCLCRMKQRIPCPLSGEPGLEGYGGGERSRVCGRALATGRVEREGGRCGGYWAGGRPPARGSPGFGRLLFVVEFLV